MSDSDAFEWVKPCPVSKNAGWCISGAGCPIMLRYINHSMSFKRAHVSECPFLRKAHPQTGNLVNGYQFDLFSIDSKNEVKP
jgi:hypothetical protein